MKIIRHWLEQLPLLRLLCQPSLFRRLLLWQAASVLVLYSGHPGAAVAQPSTARRHPRTRAVDDRRRRRPLPVSTPGRSGPGP